MTRRLTWTSDGWEDYQSWFQQDPKSLKKIDKLIESMMREPFEGIGKPEPLREDLAGFWSRRIDDAHRIVYAVDDVAITIIQCRGHY